MEHLVGFVAARHQSTFILACILSSSNEKRLASLLPRHWSVMVVHGSALPYPSQQKPSLFCLFIVYWEAASCLCPLFTGSPHSRSLSACIDLLTVKSAPLLLFTPVLVHCASVAGAVSYSPAA